MGTALVTGATSGLGREFCWQLAEARHDLVIVARDQMRLEALAEELRQIAAVRVEVIVADLAVPEDVGRVCARLSMDARPIGLLINNAGFGLGVPFLDNDLSRENYALDVMVRAIMETCQYAGQSMRSRGRGAILNVASVAADTGMGTYSAHKAWVRAFTEGLAVELAGSGVTATAVSPGLVRTEFHQRAGADMSGVPSFVWSSSEAVVEAALAAVRRGAVLVVPTMPYKVMSALTRLIPRSVVRGIVQHLPHM